MTISNQDRREQYNGDGSTTAFAYTWRIQSAGDLTVVLRASDGTETVQTETTHYTVEGVGVLGGGTVTMVTPPASGEVLSVFVDPDLVQLTAFGAGGPYDGDAHENALDYLLNLIKRAHDLSERSLRLGDGDVDGSGDYAAGSNKITGLALGSAGTDAASVATVNALIAAALIDSTQAISTFAASLLAAADTDAFLALLQYDNGATNAAAYDLQERIAAFKTVQDWGAVGDGSTSDAAAFALAAADAAAAGYEVYVPDTGSDYILTSQPNIALFWGPGTVASSGGTRYYVKPKPGKPDAVWFEKYRQETVADNASSDAAASLQAAVTLAQSNDIPLILPPRVQYRTLSSIVALQGTALVHTGQFTLRKELTLYGNGAEIRPEFNGAAIDVQAQAALATFALGDQLGQVVIEDLHFDFTAADTGGYTGAYALKLGRQGYVWSSEVRSRITDIKISGRDSSFTVQAIQVINARNIDFERCVSGISYGGILFQNPDNDADGFCGDINVVQCDLRGEHTDGKRPIHILGNDTVDATTAHCENIVFDRCLVYGVGTKIEAGETDAMRHIVFRDCFFEAFAAGGRQFIVETTGSTNPGYVDRLMVQGCEFSHLPGTTGGNQMRLVASGSTYISSMQVIGCIFRDAFDGGSDDCAIYVDNVDGLVIAGCHFQDCLVTDEVIYAESTQALMVYGCMVLESLPTGCHFVTINDDSTSDNWNVFGNTLNLDTGSAVDVIANSGSGTGSVDGDNIAI